MMRQKKFVINKYRAMLEGGLDIGTIGLATGLAVIYAAENFFLWSICCNFKIFWNYFRQLYVGRNPFREL